MPIDNAGNTTTAVRNLGTLSATAQTFTDWVGDTDTNDYYRVTISNTSNLRVNLTGMSADADVYVYSADGTTLLGRGFNVGSVNETVDIGNIAPGTCYVRVLSHSGNTNYGLSVAALPLASTDLAGNTLATARNIGTLTPTTQIFKDRIGNTDTNDYYRFSLSAASDVWFNLTGLSADANILVYAADGVAVRGSGVNVGNVNEDVNLTGLVAGTYYARVYPGVATANTNYNLAIAAQLTDLAGNTVATARAITTPLSATAQTFTDSVGAADNSDYYRFILTTASDVRFNLTGLSADANILVYAADGVTVLGSGISVGNVNEDVNLTGLVEGTYYARVYPGVATTNTNYNLAIAAQVATQTDNTIATARAITTPLSAVAQTVTDWVSPADSSDYYRFTLANAGNLQLNLTGMRADADLTVYAANGTTVLASSENAGSANEIININNLAAGSYYALVNTFNGDTTNYSLSLAVSPPPVPDLAGGTVATARNLGTLSTTTQSVRDWVGSTDVNDYYRFTLASAGGFQLNLTGLSADANVTVYAADGVTVRGSGVNVGTANEGLNITNLAAGTYYARVSPGVTTANTNYTLALAAVRDLGITATAQSLNGWVGSVDPNDYYKFTLSNFSDLRLNLTGLGADANVQVYAANGTTVVGTGANTGANSEAVSINNMVAGTYYVRVYPGIATANTNYTLTFAASIVDNAGNTMATARNIGTLDTTSQTFTDRADSVDTNDYYRFALYSESDVTVELNGLTANADVVVYDSNSNVVFGGLMHSGSTSEALDINNLPAGNYYVRVYPGDATANTFYNLTLAAPGLPTWSTLVDDAGDTWDTARNLGTLPATSSLVVRDRVFSFSETSDINDFYTFTITGTRNVQLTLSGMGVDANLYLYDANVTYIIAYTENTGNTNEAINVATLAAGTYSLLVHHYPLATTPAPYNLGVATTVPGGSAGNMLLGGTGNDSLTGSTGNDTLVGETGNDTLTGGTGNDILIGDVGTDTLTGGAGADMFRFFGATSGGTDYGVDTITDFQSGTDKIQVISPNFGNIAVGTLAAASLVAAGTSLTSGTPVFIYNNTTGALSFDRDGGSGSYSAVQFATLTGTRTLVASDIQVIAA